jgi:hypothetical protein
MRAAMLAGLENTHQTSGMKKENLVKKFLNETPGDTSLWTGYREHMWYDGPMIFSIGSSTRRYFFQALAEDERSKEANVIPYLVVPMTGKRENDLAENKLSLRQAVLHSGGRVFKTYDNGKTFEVVDTLLESELCQKGTRLDYNHPAWHRKWQKRMDKRRRRSARLKRSGISLKSLPAAAPADHIDI